MEILNYLYPFVVGYIVSPIISWLKTKIQVDVPILWWFITVAINAILVFTIAFVVSVQSGTELGLESILQFLMAQVTSQLKHATKKTGDKLLLGDPK